MGDKIRHIANSLKLAMSIVGKMMSAVEEITSSTAWILFIQT